MEISLAAEKIFNIGNIEITNSIISAFIVVFFIVLGVILIGRKLNIANPGKLQIVLEMLAEGLISQISDVLGMDRTKKIFNFVFTFFVFILISNLFGLLPFVPAIGFELKPETETLEIQAQGFVQAVQAEENTVTEEDAEVVALSEADSHKVSITNCLK